MKGLTVSVGYAETLARTLPTWDATLDGVTVVTTPTDTATRALCAELNVPCFITRYFYTNGAAFDKGGALSEAMYNAQPDDWWCLFDADILPPLDWRLQLPSLTPGKLYGAHRWQSDTGIDRPDLVQLGDLEFPGYFWLFSADDPHFPQPPEPMFTSWEHAGGYDTDFQGRWDRGDRVRLSLRLLHLGDPGKNWYGVDTGERVQEMYRERRRRGGFDHERR